MDELAALIDLLDDPDRVVQAGVRRRLHELGYEAVGETLRRACRMATGRHRAVLDETLHALFMDVLEKDWNQMMKAPLVDLEQGVFLLARYDRPELDVDRYRRILDGFAEQVRFSLRRVKGHKRALMLGRYMTEVLGFEGNRTAYTDPHNSYLHWVIDHRKGIPVSLSVLYLLLGQRLRLPVYGVNLPTHFLVKYRDDQLELFIDVFNRCRAISKQEGMTFLRKAGIEPRDVHFISTDARTILLRMVRNLAFIGERQNLQPLREDMHRLLDPWENQ